MAKITKQAQEILCNMIDEKAAAKRAELVEALEKVRAAKDDAFKCELLAVRPGIMAAFEEFNNRVAALLKKNRLAFCERRYGRGSYNAGDLICDGRVRELNDVGDIYLKTTDKSLEKAINDAQADVADLNKKVESARRETILRATLSGDYDEILKLVNGISF